MLFYQHGQETCPSYNVGALKKVIIVMVWGMINGKMEKIGFGVQKGGIAALKSEKFVIIVALADSGVIMTVLAKNIITLSERMVNMSCRISTSLVAVAVCFMLVFVGCGPKTDLSLKFTPSDVTTYTVVSENHTTFKFEMPSSNNYKEDVSEKSFSITFDQEIQSVDETGVATAKITIKGMKYTDIDKGNVKFEYDSASAKDKKEALGKLIGKSYTITIDPKGQVAVLDVEDARKVVKTGVAASKAKGILSDKAIVSRHEVVTLAKLEKSEVSVGDTWSTVEKPGYKLLMPRTFEKVYTLDEIRDDGGNSVAVVNMKAVPAGASEKGDFNPAMLMFSSMMDAEEDFSGKMEYDVTTGKVLAQDETLKVKYIATDPKDNGAEPDILTITLVYGQSAEVVK